MTLVIRDLSGTHSGGAKRATIASAHGPPLQVPRWVHRPVSHAPIVKARCQGQPLPRRLLGRLGVAQHQEEHPRRFRRLELFIEVARAIATGAQLILLDKVMAGLTPVEVAAMLDTLRRVRASRGLTLLVIEHVMRALMELCSRIVVLHHGRLIAQGEPQEIGRNEKVLSVYFGVSGE